MRENQVDPTIYLPQKQQACVTGKRATVKVDLDSLTTKTHETGALSVPSESELHCVTAKSLVSGLIVVW